MPDDLRRAVGEMRRGREPARGTIPGWMVNYENRTDNLPLVTDSPGKVYVMLDTGEGTTGGADIVKAWCRLRPVTGWPVLVGRTRERPNEYTVLLIDKDAMGGAIDGEAVVGHHHLMHEWGPTGSDDVVFSRLLQLYDFGVWPHGPPQVIEVMDGFFNPSGTHHFFPRQAFGLSQWQPSGSNDERWVLVCLSPTGTIETWPGADLPFVTIDDIPDSPPYDWWELAAVKLKEGVETPIMRPGNEWIIDLRFARVGWPQLYGGAPHDPVTLEAVLDTRLLSLNVQELLLDSQASGTIFGVPWAGDAQPDWRFLTDDDVPDIHAHYPGTIELADLAAGGAVPDQLLTWDGATGWTPKDQPGTSAWDSIIIVDPDGNGDFTNINDAYDSIDPGDRVAIWLMPATYNMVPIDTDTLEIGFFGMGATMFETVIDYNGTTEDYLFARSSSGATHLRNLSLLMEDSQTNPIYAVKATAGSFRLVEVEVDAVNTSNNAAADAIGVYSYDSSVNLLLCDIGGEQTHASAEGIAAFSDTDGGITGHYTRFNGYTTDVKQVSPGTISLAYCSLENSTTIGMPFTRLEPGHPNTYDVDKGGWGTAFTSIQDAHDAATAGDTLHLYPGTYTETLTITKSLAIIGMTAGYGSSAATPGVVIDAGTNADIAIDSSGTIVRLENLFVKNHRTGGSAACTALRVTAGSVQSWNCQFYADNGVTLNAYGVSVTGGTATLWTSLLQALTSGPGGFSYGAHTNGGTVSLFGGQASGADFDLYNQSGTLNVSFVVYDSSSGTITFLDASSILTSLLTVDGSGSGLDADLVDGKEVFADTTDRTVGSGKDHATVQAAIDWFKDKIVVGQCTITVDAGTYDELISFVDLSVLYPGGLKLVGDTRVLAGISYVDGASGNQAGLTNGGSGTVTLSNSGTTLTVACATTNPDFQTDGWGNGDKVLVLDNSGTVTEYTISSVATNVLTLTATAPTVGNDGTAICFLPDRRIAPSSSGTPVSNYCNNIVLDGFYLVPSSSGHGLFSRGNDVKTELQNVAIKPNVYGIYADNLALVVCDDGAVSSWTGTMGCLTTHSGVIKAQYAVVVKATYGFYSGTFGMLHADSTIGVSATYAYFATTQSLLYVTGATARQNTTGYYAAYGSYVRGNSTNANNNGNGTNYNPAPSIPGAAQGNFYAVIYAS